MDDPWRDMLLDLACRFRQAIQRSDPSTSPLVTLRDFPRGACADASLLLAKYLQANNCGLSFLVTGRRGGQAHAWLQLKEYIIDITADQFKDQSAAVIVDLHSSWHTSFKGNVNGVADFCLYDRRTAFELARAYETITCHLAVPMADNAQPAGTSAGFYRG